MFSRPFIVGVLATALVSPPVAVNAANTWTFGGNNCNPGSVVVPTESVAPGGPVEGVNDCPSGTNDWARQASYDEAGGNTLTVSGWGNTEDVGSDNDEKMEQGYITVFSGGLGVGNRDGRSSISPNSDEDQGELNANDNEHAIDNKDRFDFVLLDFGEGGWQLTDLGFDFVASDSDFTVLYHDGVGDAIAQLDGATVDDSGTEDLTSTGWTMIGHFGGSDTAPVDYDISAQTAGVTSRYYLVGAYAPVLSGTCFDIGHGTCAIQNSKDKFKLDSVTGVGPVTGVPEPATWLLLAAGLPWLLRRRAAA